MSGYYPAGVTGHEDAFGPHAEADRFEEVECPECCWVGTVGVMRTTWENSVDDSWECPNCGHEVEEDVTDDLYEEHLERLIDWDRDMERFGY